MEHNPRLQPTDYPPQPPPHLRTIQRLDLLIFGNHCYGISIATKNPGLWKALAEEGRLLAWLKEDQLVSKALH